ncbi:MAG: CsbD family protein [Aeromicrobium erythreum]
MGIFDKAENESTDLKGKAKETIGDATGNDDLKAEGKADQAEAGIKKAGEKIKDAVSDVKDAIKK